MPVSYKHLDVYKRQYEVYTYIYIYIYMCVCVYVSYLYVTLANSLRKKLLYSTSNLIPSSAKLRTATLKTEAIASKTIYTNSEYVLE